MRAILHSCQRSGCRHAADSLGGRQHLIDGVDEAVRCPDVRRIDIRIVDQEIAPHIHDLHLLAVNEGIRRVRQGDTLKPILKAPDRDELMHWLRHRPLVHCDEQIRTLMVHAGVYPGWRRKQLVAYAREVEGILRGPDYGQLLRTMYGRRPTKWDPDLGGWERYRFITNACTRMRYCDLKGNLNFTQKGPPGSQPKRLVPWFDHPDLQCRKWRIVFGHWSALGYFQAGRLVSLDSGCVWGGKLTMVRLDNGENARCWQVKCR